MTLPTSGSISAEQIRDEFGPTTESGEQVALGEYRVEKNFGELSEIPMDEGIPQGNDPISFDDFHGKKLNVIVDYYTSKYTDYTRESEGEAMNIRDRFTSGTDVHVDDFHFQFFWRGPDFRIPRFADFQTPPEALSAPDKLSDPNLTPLPMDPGIKYVRANSPCCDVHLGSQQALWQSWHGRQV